MIFYVCLALSVINVALGLTLYRLHLRVKENKETLVQATAALLTVSQATTSMSDAVQINIESLANSFKITVDDYGTFKSDMSNFVELVVNYLKEVKALKSGKAPSSAPPTSNRGNLN